MLPRWLGSKESTCQCRRLSFDPQLGKIPWRRKCQPTPVFLPRTSYGQRSLAGYSSWGCKRVGHDSATQQQQLVMLSIFSCAFWPLAYFLWRNVCQIFCQFFDWWKDIKKDTKLLELFVYFGDYSLVDCFICKYFSHSESCSFVYGFLCCARAFKFNQIPFKIYFNFFYFLLKLFIFIILGYGPKKILLQLMSKSVLHMFSSKNFIVSGFTFRSLIYFEFIFVYGVRECSYFILLHVAVQFSKCYLWKRLSFLHCIFLSPLSQIRGPQMYGFISELSTLQVPVPLTYISVFLPVPYCIDHCSIV